MKKIVGIQSPHYAYNYGAVLQAYAMSSAIKKLGMDVITINRRSSTNYIFANWFQKSARKAQTLTNGKFFIEFENNYIQPQSKLILNNGDYKLIKDIDFHAVIVGSDQIWRDDFFKSSFEYNSFLDFVTDEKTRKISYAPSFGKETCKHPDEVKTKISKLLKQFTAISVREESGLDILKEEFGVIGTHVLDPTLLLTEDFYTKALNLPNEQLDYMGAYVLGGNVEKTKVLNIIEKKMNYKVKSIYKESNFRLFYNYHIALLKRFLFVPSVIEFVSIIKNSKYVITDSFHGLAFSIIFRKQFVVFDNKAGGSQRFLSLLKILDLEERLLEWSEDPDIICKMLKKEIDYTTVELNLNKQRELSFSFLKNALSIH